jgi:hypothetical protein
LDSFYDKNKKTSLIRMLKHHNKNNRAASHPPFPATPTNQESITSTSCGGGGSHLSRHLACRGVQGGNPSLIASLVPKPLTIVGLSLNLVTIIVVTLPRAYGTVALQATEEVVFALA